MASTLASRGGRLSWAEGWWSLALEPMEGGEVETADGGPWEEGQGWGRGPKSRILQGHPRVDDEGEDAPPLSRSPPQTPQPSSHLWIELWKTCCLLLPSLYPAVSMATGS